MQTYEVYLADECSCDSDWQLLGIVEALDQDQAEAQVMQADRPDELIVVCVPVVRALIQESSRLS